jgi:hypothetical protein
VQKLAGHMRNHRYHEPLDIYGMVLEHRPDSACGNTMKNTMLRNSFKMLEKIAD